MKIPDGATLKKMLDGLFDLALTGLPGEATAGDMAAEYLQTAGSLHEQTRRLVRWQVAKCATSGFLTGLGGLLTLPVTVPADLGANWYIQIRMVAVIAIMHGQDPRQDRVRTLVYLCLVGDGINEILKEVGIIVGKHAAKELVERISGEAIRAINRAVGMRLVTKFGTKAPIKMAKAIPLVGGLIGAAFDGAACWAVAAAAMRVFGDGGDDGDSAASIRAPSGGPSSDSGAAGEAVSV